MFAVSVAADSLLLLAGKSQWGDAREHQEHQAHRSHDNTIARQLKRAGSMAIQFHQASLSSCCCSRAAAWPQLESRRTVTNSPKRRRRRRGAAASGAATSLFRSLPTFPAGSYNCCPSLYDSSDQSCVQLARKHEDGSACRSGSNRGARQINNIHSRQVDLLDMGLMDFSRLWQLAPRALRSAPSLIVMASLCRKVDERHRSSSHVQPAGPQREKSSRTRSSGHEID